MCVTNLTMNNKPVIKPTDCDKERKRGHDLSQKYDCKVLRAQGCYIQQNQVKCKGSIALSSKVFNDAVSFPSSSISCTQTINRDGAANPALRADDAQLL